MIPEYLVNNINNTPLDDSNTFQAVPTYVHRIHPIKYLLQYGSPMLKIAFTEKQDTISAAWKIQNLSIFTVNFMFTVYDNNTNIVTLAEDIILAGDTWSLRKGYNTAFLLKNGTFLGEERALANRIYISVPHMSLQQGTFISLGSGLDWRENLNLSKAEEI